MNPGSSLRYFCEIVGIRPNYNIKTVWFGQVDLEMTLNLRKKMDLWHKTIQKDHYHWVPKGEDPLDTKWSQKRRIPNFGNWFSEGKDSRILWNGSYVP